MKATRKAKKATPPLSNGKLRFAPRKSILTLSLSEEDRSFILERDRRQEQAGRSGKVLVGPLQPERG